jgi:hypothetical protein
MPIVVSTLRPSCTAVAEAPLPRCRGDQAVVSRVEVEHLHRFLSDEAVTGAVEAVATDAMVPVHPHRQGIEVRRRRHGLVECGVHHCDMRNRRHALQREANAE